ncbi:MAG: hypothetical protein KDA88_24665, partial [Planctomycetaceae bacterium]|nr:hypothetical protein [Planctomycetaceae bacterium]
MNPSRLLNSVLTLCTCLVLTSTLFAQQDAAEESKADDIRELKLRDWQPRSMLKTKVTRVNLPKYPIIDVHNHLGG